MTHRTVMGCLIAMAVSIIVGCAHQSLKVERTVAYQAYQAGEYAEAAERFEMLVEEIPKDAELWFRLGNSYAKAMQPEKAVGAYENALLRNPEMAKAWYNMGLVYLQAALKTFGDMRDYVAEDDPVGRQGMRMREGLVDLLEGPAEQEADEQ